MTWIPYEAIQNYNIILRELISGSLKMKILTTVLLINVQEVILGSRIESLKVLTFYGYFSLSSFQLILVNDIDE